MGKLRKSLPESRVKGRVSSPVSHTHAQRKRLKPRGALSHPETCLPQDFYLSFFSRRWVKLRAPPQKMVVPQEWGLQRPSAPRPRPPTHSTAPDAAKLRDSRGKEETREGAAALGARTRPASGNSRVTDRRRRAPRGEAVADRWRLRTGSAHCAPQLPNRPPACPPAASSARQSARVRWWVRSLLPFARSPPPPPPPPRPPHPHPTPLASSRLRHPPAPHTQDKNALPGTTQQRLDGFGHGPAVAYPQHYLQPLRLGESFPAAALLASVTAAPLCLSGSRRAPLRTRRAASQAWALCCREPPTPPPS